MSFANHTVAKDPYPSLRTTVISLCIDITDTYWVKSKITVRFEKFFSCVKWRTTEMQFCLRVWHGWVCGSGAILEWSHWTDRVWKTVLLWGERRFSLLKEWVIANNGRWLFDGWSSGRSRFSSRFSTPPTKSPFLGFFEHHHFSAAIYKKRPVLVSPDRNSTEV